MSTPSWLQEEKSVIQGKKWFCAFLCKKDRMMQVLFDDDWHTLKHFERFRCNIFNQGFVADPLVIFNAALRLWKGIRRPRVDLIQIPVIDSECSRSVLFPLQPTTATCRPVPCWPVMWIWPQRRGSTFVRKFWPSLASLEITVSNQLDYWYMFTRKRASFIFYIISLWCAVLCRVHLVVVCDHFQLTVQPLI